LIITATGRWGEVVGMPLPNLLAILAAAVLGIGAGEVLVISAIPRIGTSRAYALASSYPLFTALIAVIVLGETLTLMAGTGAVLIVVGAGMLSLEPTAFRVSGRLVPTSPRASAGAGLALLASILFALDLIVLKVALDGLSPEAVNAVRMPLATVGLHLAALVATQDWPVVRLGRRDSLVALLSGLFALTIGGFMFLSGIQQIGAARAAALSGTSPVFVLILSRVFLGERARGASMLGVFACAAGVALLTMG
jgi:drug/metabolite transporter (DMT)-like permease